MRVAGGINIAGYITDGIALESLFFVSRIDFFDKLSAFIIVELRDVAKGRFNRDYLVVRVILQCDIRSIRLGNFRDPPVQVIIKLPRIPSCVFNGGFPGGFVAVIS